MLEGRKPVGTQTEREQAQQALLLALSKLPGQQATSASALLEVARNQLKSGDNIPDEIEILIIQAFQALRRSSDVSWTATREGSTFSLTEQGKSKIASAQTKVEPTNPRLQIATSSSS